MGSELVVNGKETTTTPAPEHQQKPTFNEHPDSSVYRNPLKSVMSYLMVLYGREIYSNVEKQHNDEDAVLVQAGTRTPSNAHKRRQQCDRWNYQALQREPVVHGE